MEPDLRSRISLRSIRATKLGETGVANKETEAPPLSFHILPGLRASRGRVLQRSGEEARRENDGCCPVR